MLTTVALFEFQDFFKGSQYENDFSIEGLTAIFEYIEQWEMDNGEDFVFGSCADISSQFTEYDSIIEAAREVCALEPDEEDEEEYQKLCAFSQLEHDGITFFETDSGLCIVTNLD